MTALLWASYEGHLPVVRELVNVYKVNLFQKDKVRLTHALVTVHYNLSYRTTYVYVHQPTFVLVCSPYYQIMESI